jgi:hypothetical protein
MYGSIALISLGLATIAGALPLGSPVTVSNTNSTSDAVTTMADQYFYYRGNGSPEAGWPSPDRWYSYDALWSANYPLMRQSCGWNGWGADNSEEEISNINSAIRQVSGETGIDARFILAVVMQESKGCVRAPTTNNGVVNPGLMQSHNGSGSCAGVNPCPSWTIVQMIRDGTAGTNFGEGLRQIYGTTSGALGAGSRATYAAARKYNSGSVDYNDLGIGFGSTNCYASDIANRLTGWTLAASQCW